MSPQSWRSDNPGRATDCARAASGCASGSGAAAVCCARRGVERRGDRHTGRHWARRRAADRPCAERRVSRLAVGWVRTAGRRTAGAAARRSARADAGRTAAATPPGSRPGDNQIGRRPPTAGAAPPDSPLGDNQIGYPPPGCTCPRRAGSARPAAVCPRRRRRAAGPGGRTCRAGQRRGRAGVLVGCRHRVRRLAPARHSGRAPWAGGHRWEACGRHSPLGSPGGRTTVRRSRRASVGVNGVHPVVRRSACQPGQVCP